MADNEQGLQDPPQTLPRLQAVEPPAIAPARICREVLRTEIAEIVRRRRRLNGEGDRKASWAGFNNDSDVEQEDSRDDESIRQLRRVRDGYARRDNDPPTALPEE